MGQLLDIAESLFESDPAQPIATEETPTPTPGTPSANDQATTFNILINEGIDPRQIFREPPSLDAQKLLGKKALAEIGRYYGPSSIFTDPEDRTILEDWFDVSPQEIGLPRGGFSEILRNIFGSSGSEEQIQAASEAVNEVMSRSSIFAGAKSMRARRERYGETPTRAELTGAEVPKRPSGEEYPPYLKQYLRSQPGYELETAGGRARVIERDYGLISQLPDADRIGSGLRQDIAWGMELPNDSEGKNVALEFVKPILLKEINARYRTEPDGSITNPYTEDQLKLQIVDLGPDGKRIAFRHPSDPDKLTLLDPVNFEWGDVWEILPMLVTPASEISTAVGGGLLSAFMTGGNPVAVFAGTTAAAAGGAFLGRLLTQTIGLEKLGYTKDSRRGGYVKRKADGKEVIVTFEDLMFDRMTDVEWSLLGSGGGAALWRGARAFFTRGASEIDAFIPEKDFIEAAEAFSKSQRGIELRAANIQATPSYILERKADDILRAAEDLNDPTASAKALKLANRYRLAANKLRLREESTDLAAGRRGEIAAYRVGQAKVEAGVEPKPVARDPEMATELGESVALAIEKGAISDIHAGLKNLADISGTLIDDFRALIGKADETIDAATFSQRLSQSVDEIFGAAKGAEKWTTKTGIDGIRNHIRAAAAQKIKGRQLRAFNIGEADEAVETAIKRLKKSMGSAFPGELQAAHRTMVKETGGMTNYRELDAAINKIDDYIAKAAKEGNVSYLPNLNNLKSIYEKIRIEGLNKLDPNLAVMFKAAKTAELEVHEIWTNAIKKGLQEGNAETVFSTLFKGFRTPDAIDSLIAGLVTKRPTLIKGQLEEGAALATSSDLDLLRNLLKVNYKKALGTVNIEEGGGVAATVGGRGIPIVLDDGTRFRAVPVSGGQGQKFIDEYKAWIKALFPDDVNFAKYTDVLVRGYGLQREAKRIAKAEADLRNQPWIRSGDLRIDDDLGRVISDEPQRIIETALNAESSGEAIKSLKRIFATAYGKNSAEYGLADYQMRSLIFRRLLRPDDLAAAAKTGSVNPLESTQKTIGFIEAYLPAMNATFGRGHTQNIKRFFQEAADAIKQAEVTTYARTVAGATPGWVKGVMAGPIGIIAKVYVGMLNRRARALNLTTKFLGEGDASKFDRLLNDGELLARVLRIRKGTPRNKIMVNALGSALMITEDRAEEVLDTYTVTDAKGQIQPWAPTVTKEEVARKNLMREFQAQ
jgi:hypothetical protein